MSDGSGVYQLTTNVTNMASLVADYRSSGESDDDVDSDSVPEL